MHEWRVTQRGWPPRTAVVSAAERWLTARADQVVDAPHPSPESLPLAELAGKLTNEEAVAQRFTDAKGLEWDLVLLRSEERLFVMTHPASGHAGRLTELALVYSTLARSRDAVVFTDVSGTLLGASPRWRRLYGYDLGEILGGNPRLINSRLHSRNFFQELWLDLTRRDVGTWSGELANRKKNGELVSVWQTITAYRGPEEPIIGYLGIARDLTSHRELQDRILRGTQELERHGRLKDEQLTTVVHDIKAPLQGIIGHLDLALAASGGSLRPRARTHLDSALTAAHRLDGMVRSLLDLRRFEAGRLRLEIGRVSVHTLLRASIDLQSAWAARKDVTIDLSVSGPSRPAFVDELRLEEVIGNLLSNAVRHSPAGGRVCVELEVREDGWNRVLFDDEGPGIPESERERVFEAFRQLPGPGESARAGSEGIGWGLAISKAILELHGGTIRADRSPQGGCRMEIGFPSNWPALGERLWAAAVFDPGEKIWPEIARRLRSRGLPCFVAATAGDLSRILDHELPNLYVADGESLGPELANLRSFGGPPAPQPLELSAVSAGGEPPSLRFLHAEGPSPLLAAAREYFPELTAATPAPSRS